LRSGGKTVDQALSQFRGGDSTIGIRVSGWRSEGDWKVAKCDIKQVLCLIISKVKLDRGGFGQFESDDEISGSFLPTTKEQ